MTSMAKDTRWTRKRNMWSRLRRRTPRAVAANMIDRESFWLLQNSRRRLERQHERGSQLVVLPPQSLGGSASRGVVAFAGQNLEVVVGRFHLRFAQFAVLGGFLRLVARGLLGGQRCGIRLKAFINFFSERTEIIRPPVSS